MEAEYIKDTKEHIKSLPMTEDEYFTGGGLIPPVLNDIRDKKVSVVYVAQHHLFQNIYKRLPADIKEEYFCSIDVFYLANQTRLSTHIQEAING